MKRGLLSIGAAVALAAAALPISADAQNVRGAAGSPGGISAGGAPGGGVSAGARGGMSAGPAISAPRSGGNFAVSPGVRTAPSAGVRTAPSQSYAQGGGNWQGSGRNWQGGNWQHHRRHHFRGSAFAFGFAAPYYYDYATPYAYEDDGCWQVRLRRGEYVRVWVCD